MEESLNSIDEALTSQKTNNDLQLEILNNKDSLDLELLKEYISSL